MCIHLIGRTHHFPLINKSLNIHFQPLPYSGLGAAVQGKMLCSRFFGHQSKILLFLESSKMSLGQQNTIVTAGVAYLFTNVWASLNLVGALHSLGLQTNNI